MRDQIQRRFKFNIKRVENLIAIYDEATKSSVKTVKSNAPDVLRAAVVFLHASIEDLIRGLVGYRLPKLKPEAYAKIPFNQDIDKSDKVSLVELAKHRKKSVEAVLEQATKSYLANKTFNNLEQILEALRRIKIETPETKRLAESVIPMMERRHQIVHRADRSDVDVEDHGQKWAITKADVVKWQQAVELLAEALIKACK